MSETSKVAEETVTVLSKTFTASQLNGVVESSALVAGIIWSQNDLTKFVTHPISSTFNGLLYGSLCCMGATIVSEKLPNSAKPYFAGLIGISAGYYLLKNLYAKYNNELPEQSTVVNVTINNKQKLNNLSESICVFGFPIITINRTL